jgi:NAD(P)H-flavin reductase
LYDSHPDQLSFVLPTEHNESFLARAQVGAFLDLLTPVGHGIEFAASTRHVLLLGEGNRGLALLAIAALAVRSGREVAFSVYACPGEMPVPQHLLAPEIEYHTEQDAAETDLLAWADQTIACGSHFFYRRILDHARQADLQLSQGQVRILIDPVMPCGNGTCGACGVISGRRLQLACVDGPWFDILML